VSINFLIYLKNDLGAFFCPLNRMTLDDKKSPKKPPDFLCECCDFECSKKKEWMRHISTRKHQENDAELRFGLQKSPKKPLFFYNCECGKKYKYRQGLWKHRQTCDYTFEIESDENTSTGEDDPTDKKLIMLLLKENNEMKHMMLDICKQIKPTTTNINSNNKTFNLNLFLNEECKDAMNIMDFVNSLKLKLSDLENVGKMGYVDGISNIIINNLKALDIHKRPVHCSDSKREVLYIKDQDKWEKENEEKIRIKKAIKQVANKNIHLISKWKEKYPECACSDSSKSDEYNHIIIESMSTNENDEDKIIRNVAKQVVINKNI